MVLLMILAALQPYETRFIYVTSMYLHATVNLDDILTNSASISAPANDVNLANNSFTNSKL
jgi:hypothetical protein